MDSALTLDKRARTRKPPEGNVSRLSLAVPSETKERIKRLQASTGAATLTETIASGLKLYEWLVEQRRLGREIMVREPGGEPTVVQFVF